MTIAPATMRKTRRATGIGGTAVAGDPAAGGSATCVWSRTERAAMSVQCVPATPRPVKRPAVGRTEGRVPR
ncbi:hypothetical protein CP979_04055 [Streptomyces filamentosus]|nr:hypothetical protein CP979_04055 [Streptomyces filamentosus]